LLFSTYFATLLSVVQDMETDFSVDELIRLKLVIGREAVHFEHCRDLVDALLGNGDLLSDEGSKEKRSQLVFWV